MVFEVPWDFFRGPRGPISAPGHDRIFSTGDFSHLWGALHRHASRFSGLFFGSKRGFKWYVIFLLRKWDFGSRSSENPNFFSKSNRGPDFNGQFHKSRANKTNFWFWLNISNGGKAKVASI